MPTDESYFEYILEQLSELEDIRARKMFGEYILYYKDRIFGGIYDNRLLVKSVKAAEDHLKDITLEMPYEGAKPMYLVDNTDDRDYLKGLVEAMYEQLPPPRSKKKKGKKQRRFFVN